MKEFDGICLQLGLYRSAEYLPVCFEDFSEKSPRYYLVSKHEYPVFKELEVNRFRYIGFDCCPVSIQHMHDLYNTEVEQEWVEFVCAYVLGKGGIKRSYLHDCCYNKPYDQSIPHDWRPTFSVGFGDILNHYVKEFGKIDFVAMDIEGAEFHILQHYDFTIRPKFLDIEIHESEGRGTKITEFIEGMKLYEYECVSLYTEPDRPTNSIQQALFKDKKM